MDLSSALCLGVPMLAAGYAYWRSLPPKQVQVKITPPALRGVFKATATVAKSGSMPATFLVPLRLGAYNPTGGYQEVLDANDGPAIRVYAHDAVDKTYGQIVAKARAEALVAIINRSGGG